MDEKFLISGGIPRVLGELIPGHVFKKAELAEINFTKKTYKPVLNYISPKEYCADIAPSITFGGFCRVDSKFYIPTRTEVLVLDAATYEVEEVITDPLFNDLHDVLVKDGILYVAVTGMDAVFKIHLNTRERTIVNIAGKLPFHRFKESDNLNKRSSLKPHEAHPNNLFEIDNQIWVTRLKMMDAVCIEDISNTINISAGLPHDGFVKDNFIYFTTVNGYVVIIDKATMKESKSIKLTGEKEVEGTPLGWCRGIYVDEDYFYVGFTKLRTTKFTENLDWVKTIVSKKKLIDKPLPTRIEKYTIDGTYVSQFIFPKDSIFNIFSIIKINID
ncbi:hypothetical protein [Patiriisocius sp. Uisw_047]|jgi:hypothetical protein|uniref:hypothetical protein n=1 Tax=Patiriisocius sp. Uisw_047 TaxID=3230969 RepID=UPI0039EB7791